MQYDKLWGLPRRVFTLFVFLYLYLEEDLADVVVQHVGYVTCCASWTGGMFAPAAPAAAASQ